MAQVKTPRPRKAIPADTPAPAPAHSTPAVESVQGSHIPAEAPAPAPAPTPAPAPAVTPLLAAAQRVMEANLQGVPLALTRGLITPRDSGSQSMSLPRWVGCLSSHTSTTGRILSPETVYLSLYQGIAQPGPIEFQTYGLEHQGQSGSRLQKQMTITLGENRMHTVPEDMAIMEQVQVALINRDLFVVSLDRLRLYQRSNSGKPVSDNIILEAYDPATGELVWRNPRISVDHAISATLGTMGTVPPAMMIMPLVPKVSAPAPAPAAPPVAAPAVPQWFVNLRAEGDAFGIQGDNLVRYIVSKRAGVLVAAGVASSEAEAQAMATTEVQGFMGTAPASSPVPVQTPTPAAPAPVEAPKAPGSTDAVAAGMGLMVPGRPAPAPRPKATTVAMGPLPAAIDLEHLVVIDWRPQVTERILNALKDQPEKSATAQKIREIIGLPLGFKAGTDLERIGNALKRFLYRMEADRLITAEGATRSRTYKLV